MIYIKNTTETQTIFIPRNELQKEAYVTSTKTYEDGYREGLEDGKEYQKDKLLNLYVTENGQYEREDGWGVVTVDVPIVECPDCSVSYEEGYEIGKNKGYEDGFQDGYEQGKSDCPECDDCPELTSINITKNGSYEGAFKLVNVDVPNEGGSCNLTETSINLNKESATIIASDEGFDGYSKVTVTAWAYGDVRYAEGYEQGRADYPKLTSINITENGRYEGAYNVVNVDVPTEDCDGAYNQGYQDGYNQGQNDCPSEGGCNLEDKTIIPSTADVDANGFIVVKPDSGYDAMNSVAIDVSNIKSEWITTGKNSITDYYWCPLTVSDSGFGERAKSFSLADEQTIYDEDNVLIDRNDMFYLPTANNLNEFRLTKKAVKIMFPFNNVDAQHISKLYLNEDVESFGCMDKNLSALSTIEVGKNITTFVLSNCNLLKLNKIVVHTNNNCDVLLTHNVKSTGTLYVNENNDYKNKWINALPSGWTVEYL